jgi:hypothetical protein
MAKAWENSKVTVGFEVLTEAVMKSHFFWDIMLCSPSKGLYGVVSQNIEIFNILFTYNFCISELSFWDLMNDKRLPNLRY